MQATGWGPVATMYQAIMQAGELTPEQLELGGQKLQQLHKIHRFLKQQRQFIGVLETRNFSCS